MNRLRSRTTRLALGAAVFAAATALPLAAVKQAAPAGTVSPSLFRTVYYRPLSVFSRGGRVTAVTGVPSKPGLFYMGAARRRRVDARPIPARAGSRSPTARSASARSARSRSSLSNPNVIYVGTGSADPRGNVTNGDGVYKSTDAGKTWTHVGLEKAGLIGRIRIHPQNPDIAYVAALGNIFGPNPERGVYRTKDGGKTWEQVLKVSDKTGAIDVTMDPKNPNTLFATMWTDAADAVDDRLGQHGRRPLPLDRRRRPPGRSSRRGCRTRRDVRQDRRVDLAGGSEARLRADRSRRRPGRRLSLGGRRRLVGAA